MKGNESLSEKDIDFFRKLGPLECVRRLDINAIHEALKNSVNANSSPEDKALLIKAVLLKLGVQAATETINDIYSANSQEEFVQLIGIYRRGGWHKEASSLAMSYFQEYPGSARALFHYLGALYFNGELSKIESTLVTQIESQTVHRDFFFDWLVRLRCYEGLKTYRHKFETALSDYQKSLADMFDEEVHWPMDGLVLNLERDKHRFEIMRQLWADQIDLSRLSGVNGASLPDLAIEKTCTATPALGSGAVACAFGHLKALEIASENKIGRCAIFEDDAAPYFPMTDKIAQGCEKYDLIFVNDRNSRGFRERRGDQELAAPSKELLGGGCDGYIVSTKAADKILSYVKKRGIHRHIDGLIINLSVTGEISAATTSSPLVQHFDFNYSARLQEYLSSIGGN